VIDDDSSSAAAATGFRGSGTDHCRLMIGALGGSGHGLCGGFEFGRARGHQVDELAHGGVEAVGESNQGFALFGLAALLELSLFCFQRACRDSRPAQHFKRFSHTADFVATIGFLDGAV
jgi:hypothetical protein